MWHASERRRGRTHDPGRAVLAHAAPGGVTVAQAIGAAAFAALGRVYRAHVATVRYRAVLGDGTIVRPREQAFARNIFALCERDVLALAGVGAGRGFTVLVALGRDGDRAASFLSVLGWQVVRGSSLRGGARAGHGLVRALAGDRPAGIVVDGPLGPAGKAKGGAVLVAMRTGRPLRALGVAARPRLVFRKTWSQIHLPLPFSRVVIACDDPLALPGCMRRAEVDNLTEVLTARLELMAARARETLALLRAGFVGTGLAARPGAEGGSRE